MATDKTLKLGKGMKVIPIKTRTEEGTSREYHYARETKGTWCYLPKLAEGERISGTNAIYLLKGEYPTKPGEVVTVTYTIG